MTDDKLPTARVIPRDRTEHLHVLRGQAALGARKAGVVGLSVIKGLALFALCGAGLVVVRAVLRPAPLRYDVRYHLDDLSGLNRLQLERLRLDVQRDLYRNLHAPFHTAVDAPASSELASEPLHQAR